jgi:spore maturation protein CgeB
MSAGRPSTGRGGSAVAAREATEAPTAAGASVVLLGRGLEGLADGCRERGLAVRTEADAGWEGVEFCLLDCCAWFRRPLPLRALKRSANRAGVPVVGWNRDAPWHKGTKRWRIALARALRLLDLYATHSLQDAASFPGQCLFLPNAAWTQRYHLHGRRLEELADPGAYRWDVSFIGNLDAVRYREHRARVEVLRALADALRADGVSVLLQDSRDLPAEQQVDIVQRSRVNLSLGAACDLPGRPSDGLPERCFGVPACGGLLLSDRRAHAALSFTPGVDWADYADAADARAQIRRWLADFAAARRLAEAAHHTVMQRHTSARRGRAAASLRSGPS